MVTGWRPSGRVRAAQFLETPRDAIVAILAAAQIRHFRTNEVQQLRAWEISIDLLQAALTEQPMCDAWVLLEYPLLRLGRRADAVVLTPAAIFVLEFKVGAALFDSSSREQVEDYALDLQDFHAGCRWHPIVPILVATEGHAPSLNRSLGLAGVQPVIDADAHSLAGLLRELHENLPAPAEPLDPAAWIAAPYRPVPTIVEAACMLYARHGVAEIAAARADTHNLTMTTQALLDAIAHARAAHERIVLFVTGIPGAGKTLCGLNAAFGAADGARATFLTGNPTLVHVLREALARDAIENGLDRRVARQQMESAIQALPRFRDHYVGRPEIPAERIVVIDEAQRCWSRDYAIRKTRDRPTQLSDSEPGHLLEIMSRHEGFSAIVCLVGSGQEIHDGEGGLAGWGAALRGQPGWRVAAPPDTLGSADPRQQLGQIAHLALTPSLHLNVPVRQIRSAAAGPWVDAVLTGDAAAARAIADAAGGVPYAITRSLADMKQSLRAARAGRVGAGCLPARARGGCARKVWASSCRIWMRPWWHDGFWTIGRPMCVHRMRLRWSPQSSPARALELDYVGLCWDGDLMRVPGEKDWRVRDFRGTRWILPAAAEAKLNQLNTYRVLLTRARYDTVIFVPLGDAADMTRDPAVFDGIADFLLAMRRY